jgi:predicted metalloprotease with PDZ domain
MAEGVTDYYAHSLLARYKLESANEFYSDIQTWLKALNHASPGAVSQSLEELSIDESNFHLENAALFYIKGPLVAWMLDLEIRHQTNNQKSLDDVMFALNRDAKQGKTFKDEDLIHLVEKYSGADLKDFYARYIAGTDTLPVAKYLGYMGLRTGQKQPSGSLTMSSDSSLVFESVDPGSLYAKAGIMAGDKLLALDNRPLTLDNIDRFVNAKNEQRKVSLTVEHNGEPKTVTLDFQQPNEARRVGPFEIDSSATALEASIRKGVAGSI